MEVGGWGLDEDEESPRGEMNKGEKKKEGKRETRANI